MKKTLLFALLMSAASVSYSQVINGCVILTGDKRDMERFADGGKSETGNRFSFSA